MKTIAQQSFFIHRKSKKITATKMGKVGLYPEHGYKRYGNVVKSKQQLELLRTIFEIDPKPHRYVIYDICHKTGLYYQECLDWFRYQRMKAKRQKNNNDTSHERPIEQATRLATPPVDWAVAFAEKCSSTNDGILVSKIQFIHSQIYSG